MLLDCFQIVRLATILKAPSSGCTESKEEAAGQDSEMAQTEER